MKKLLPILLGAAMLLLAFQSTQAPILQTMIQGIGPTWAGECAPGVIDNTSAVSRMNVTHLLHASGTGTWSAAMTYSNSSCSGPFSAYVSTATVNQGSGVPVAWAVDPRTVPAKYIKITVVGTATVIYYGTRTVYGSGSGVGSVGPSGPSGAAGAKGASGATGAAGSAGSAGASGPSGPNGATGASGPIGATGAGGPSGPTGAGGASGPSGPGGITGASGPSGASGASGPSGASGAISAVYKVRTCEIPIGTLTGSALADADDMPYRCGNTYGATATITAVACAADAGTPTVTPILTGGGATSILTGALTCGTASFAAGSLNGTPTLSAGSTINGNITTAGGTAKYILIRITMSLP